MVNTKEWVCVIEKYLFLPVSAEKSVFFCTILICAILLFWAYVLIAVRLKKLNVVMYIKAEEYLVSVLLADICFNVFYIHYALAAWCMLYILYGFIESNNRRVRYLLRIYNDKEYRFTREQKGLCNKLENPLAYSFKAQSELFSRIRHLKKEATAEAKSIPLIKAKWRACFLKPNVFMIGLTVPAIKSIIEFNNGALTDCWWYSVLESWIFLTAILYLIYPISHFLTVENEVHKLYDCEKAFKLIFCAVSVLLYFILAQIAVV